MPGRLSVLPQLQREPFSSSLQLDDLGHLRLDVSSPTGALTTVLTQAAATTARDANVPLCSYLIQCRLPRAEVACNAPSPKKNKKTNKLGLSLTQLNQSICLCCRPSTPIVVSLLFFFSFLLQPFLSRTLFIIMWCLLIRLTYVNCLLLICFIYLF